MSLSKQDIINSAIDLFGYSGTDFDGMSKKEVVNYLDDEIGEIIAYNN